MNEFPTYEKIQNDTVRAALGALVSTPNPCFDQILWDPELHVLSFRRSGSGDYVNMWLHPDGEHMVESNSGPGAHSEVLWSTR